MAGKIPLEWQAPQPEAPESYKLGWLNESVEQGQSWIESQRGYADIRKGLDILSGIGEKGNILDYRSQISGRRLKTNIRVVIAGLSNIRPIWDDEQSLAGALSRRVLGSERKGSSRLCVSCLYRLGSPSSN